MIRIPAEVRGHHAVNIDPVTELQRDGHREPAGAQPRVGDLPVFASLLLEELIELQHLVARDHEGLQPGQHLAQELQVVVDLALAVAPHVAAGAPEDEHGALAHVEQVMTVAEDPLDAGMRDDPQAGTIAHVPPEAARGCIVHADDALRLVDLRALPAVQQMTRARHQCTVPAVHSQGLVVRHAKVSVQRPRSRRGPGARGGAALRRRLRAAGRRCLLLLLLRGTLLLAAQAAVHEQQAGAHGGER